MPRISAKTLTEHRELVLGRVLDAFGEEMTEHGYAELSFAGVAARAGIARSSLYTYAADKAELMLRYVDRSVDDYIDHMRADLAELSTSRERLHHALHAQVAAFSAEPGASGDGEPGNPGAGAGTASGMLEGGSLPPEVFGALMKRLSRAHELVREILRDGIAAGEFRATTDVDVMVEMIGGVVGSQRMPVGTGQRSVAEAFESVCRFIDSALTP